MRTCREGSQCGFGMVETLVAMGIVALICLAFTTTVGYEMSGNAIAGERSQAAACAESAFEALRTGAASPNTCAGPYPNLTVTTSTRETDGVTYLTAKVSDGGTTLYQGETTFDTQLGAP